MRLQRRLHEWFLLRRQTIRFNMNEICFENCLQLYNDHHFSMLHDHQYEFFKYGLSRYTSHAVACICMIHQTTTECRRRLKKEKERE